MGIEGDVKCQQIALFNWNTDKNTSILVFLILVPRSKLMIFFITCVYNFNNQRPKVHSQVLQNVKTVGQLAYLD